MSDPNIFVDDEFVIWQPSCVDIVKSKDTEERRLGGYASTEHSDRQQEVVLQRGLDFDEFVRFGYFNDNHNQATGAVVGIPDKVAFHPGKGWYTEGSLLKGVKRADEIWELAKSLEGTTRKLGFSIEGKVLERRDNYIVKAKIRNVAITNAPVNTNCSWSILTKSFCPDFERSLGAGSARLAQASVPLEGEEAGRIVIPEDLEKKCRCTCGGCKGATRKSLVEEAEGIALIQRVRPHYSVDICRKIYHYALGKE